MITEDYVSFEIGKLLKEKGFNEYCRAVRSPSEKLFYSSNDIKNFEDKKTIGGAVAAPTLQMAIKWMRVVHNLYIEPMVIKNYDKKKFEYTYTIQDLNFPGSDDGIDSCKNWNTPEEAVGEAIKYCLENLI